MSGLMLINLKIRDYFSTVKLTRILVIYVIRGVLLMVIRQCKNENSSSLKIHFEHKYSEHQLLI